MKNVVHQRIRVLWFKCGERDPDLPREFSWTLDTWPDMHWWAIGLWFYQLQIRWYH